VPSDPTDSELERALARIVDLEVRYSHQQVELNELSEVVYRQQRVVDHLNRRIQALEKKLADADDGGPRNPEDEVPPHY
jgi:SlyX protein